MALEEKYAAAQGFARLRFEMMHGGATGNGWSGNRDLARRRRNCNTHVYARKNGWAISALVAYANATNDANALAISEPAAA